MLDNTRENLRQEGKRINAETYKWENLVDSIYKLAKNNQNLAYKKIDLSMRNPNFDDFDRQELHFIKGDIYYSNDSLNKAIIEFTLAGENFPKPLAARAGTLIKLKQYGKAYKDLNQAADINHDYLWNIGNYFEVIKQRDSAIKYYKKLYNEDTIVYKYCNNRIKELNKPKIKLYTELVFKDRERIILIIGE